jgi:hypothetical protein
MAAGSTYTPIATYSLASQTSITFSSIPSTYTDLIIVLSGTSAGGYPANFRVGNGSVDTGSNYSRTGLSGNGSSATSYGGSSEAYFYTDNGSDGTNPSAPNITHIMNYANTTTYKTFLNRNGAVGNHTRAIVGLWRSTAAINTINISASSFSWTGGLVTLYGIQAA